MFTRQHIRTCNATRRALTAFLAVLCICSASAFAEKMNSTIQEAIYDFEMKGETAEAIRLLEKVSTQGDKEDRENAFFSSVKSGNFRTTKRRPTSTISRASIRPAKRTVPTGCQNARPPPAAQTTSSSRTSSPYAPPSQRYSGTRPPTCCSRAEPSRRCLPIPSSTSVRESRQGPTF